MKYLRVAYRLFRLGLHIAAGLTITATLLRRVGTRPPTARQHAIIRWWQRRVTRILGLRIKLVGAPMAHPALLVSNHISWLDIPVLGSLFPVNFVSKIEIRRWPLLGMLAARSGTLFIQRGGKNAATQTAEQIAFRLRRGDSVAVFPEATTTDGRSVRRFHPRLFGAALHAEAHVQPLAIRYPHRLGVHPAAPFVDDDTLFRHGIRVLGEKYIEVEVTACPQLASHPADRRTLATQAHEAIRRVVEPQAELLQTRSRS